MLCGHPRLYDVEYEQGRDVVPDNGCEIPNRDNTMDVGFWHQQEKNRRCYEMVPAHISLGGVKSLLGQRFLYFIAE